MKTDPVTMYGKLKECCPTLADNDYHIRAFHPGEELLFEFMAVTCEVCDCQHATTHCPYIHPLNRTDTKKNEWVGPICHWCSGKHIGLYCSHRNPHGGSYI